MRDQHACAGIREHEGQPLLRVVWIERQISAAGLEDANEPDDHVERARKAQPHHRLRANAQRAQVMRQPVGAPIERTIAEAFILEHPRRMVARSSPLRMSRLPIARSGCATVASSRRTNRPAIASTVSRSNRSVAYSITPDIPAGVPSAPRSSLTLTARSNLAVAVATGSNRVASPGTSKRAAALFWNASITWNSGWCDSDRAGLSTSTSRSNGSSAWP